MKPDFSSAARQNTDGKPPGPEEIVERVESCIRHLQQGRGRRQLAPFVAELLEMLISHPDIGEEIHYWQHCQYYRMTRQWRWIASRSR